MIIIGTIASSGGASRVALSVTYASNTVNASLALGGIAGYVSGKSDITITINSGIYLWSNSTATPGFSMTGGASGDTVNIVNNGFIMGKGATGGTSTNGGVAISLSLNTTINNTNAAAYIGGGGAGGRTFVVSSGNSTAGGGGGGAGGGCGGRGGNAAYIPALVAGGAVGVAGSNAGVGTPSGGGGGRIFPGTGGAGGTPATSGRGGGSGGGGGVGTYCCPCGVIQYNGAAGGTGSAVGGTAGAGLTPGGSGGGGWGAAGGLISGRTIAGGVGGKAVALNAKTVTWVSGNTTRVYGTVS